MTHLLYHSSRQRRVGLSLLFVMALALIWTVASTAPAMAQTTDDTYSYTYVCKDGVTPNGMVGYTADSECATLIAAPPEGCTVAHSNTGEPTGEDDTLTYTCQIVGGGGGGGGGGSPQCGDSPVPCLWSNVRTMPLLYQTGQGVLYDMGEVKYQLYLRARADGAPAAGGRIVEVNPRPGWETVGYGTQTRVSCPETGSSGIQSCSVRVRMEKPYSISASISGAYQGVTFNLGVTPGGGANYVTMAGETFVQVVNNQTAYGICESWTNTCSTVTP